MISVVIADDQPLIRSAVRALIELEPDMSVVGEAPDGEAALELALELRPDVILLDIRMPKRDGIWVTGEIAKNKDLSQTKVLILTTFEEDEFIFQALRQGASGFLGKGADGESITGAIRSVAKGESLLSPLATKRLIEAYLTPGQASASLKSTALEPLTARELGILTQVGQGLNNQEIAEELYISPLTVKTHISKLMTKLDVHDRSQLVVEAYESGLVVPGSQKPTP